MYKKSRPGGEDAPGADAVCLRFEYIVSGLAGSRLEGDCLSRKDWPLLEVVVERPCRFRLGYLVHGRLYGWGKMAERGRASCLGKES